MLISTIPSQFKIMEKQLFPHNFELFKIENLGEFVSNINKNQLMILDVYGFESLGIQSNLVNVNKNDTISFPRHLYLYLEQLKKNNFKFS